MKYLYYLSEFEVSTKTSQYHCALNRVLIQQLIALDCYNGKLHAVDHSKENERNVL